MISYDIANHMISLSDRRCLIPAIIIAISLAIIPLSHLSYLFLIGKEIRSSYFFVLWKEIIAISLAIIPLSHLSYLFLISRVSYFSDDA